MSLLLLPDLLLLLLQQETLRGLVPESTPSGKVARLPSRDEAAESEVS